MDLRDIEYFAVIAQHGHLGRAAEALGLGQPALSVSLRRLESSADAKLVKRTPKGVELTDVGRALLGHVRRLRLAREDLARELSDLAHGRTGSLSIGASPATASGPLADACGMLLRDAPQVTLKVSISAATTVLLQALHAGELDLIVPHLLRATGEGVVRELLWDDEFVVYASARHRLAKHKAVALSDLAHERWVATPASATLAQQSLRRTFEEHGLPEPRIALTSESGEMNRRLVARSDLLGVAARRAVEQHSRRFGLKVLAVRDVSWIRPVGLVYRDDGYLSPVARRFIEILKTVAKDVPRSHYARTAP